MTINKESIVNFPCKAGETRIWIGTGSSPPRTIPILKGETIEEAFKRLRKINKIMGNKE